MMTLVNGMFDLIRVLYGLNILQDAEAYFCRVLDRFPLHFSRHLEFKGFVFKKEDQSPFAVHGFKGAVHDVFKELRQVQHGVDFPADFIQRAQVLFLRDRNGARSGGAVQQGVFPDDFCICLYRFGNPSFS